MTDTPPVVVLCGGKGRRLRTLTKDKPKPLVEVDGEPILTHIVNIFRRYGHDSFVFCIGYKGDQIRRHYRDGRPFDGDVRIECVDSGASASKAERVADAVRHTGADRFFVTYGDNVANVDIASLVETHERGGRLATVTSTTVQSPYGHVHAEGEAAVEFEEKPALSTPINAGFMLFERAAAEYLDADDGFERDLLPRLIADGELSVYEHGGFFRGIDTYKKYEQLEALVESREEYPWEPQANA
ncbi:nucleotidyltransferase family protein [Halosimplex marinum]|uniref:nucleotidyltransferase family protein n=1 Tax=Halosimplex marinum TaxID=3396620 RepID=UPI003F57994C